MSTKPRLVAASMTFVSVALFLLLHGMFPPPVQAARCLQECFEIYDECLAACNDLSHDVLEGDSGELCISECEHLESYCAYSAYMCDESEVSHCYIYSITDTYNFSYWYDPFTNTIFQFLHDHDVSVWDNGEC